MGEFLTGSLSVSPQHSAQAAVEESERMFNMFIHTIERKRTEVKELIRAQERTELGLAEGLQEKLEKEITDLKKRDGELAELAETEDHVHFLQVMFIVMLSSICEDRWILI